jgi:hypothetical protein
MFCIEPTIERHGMARLVYAPHVQVGRCPGVRGGAGGIGGGSCSPALFGLVKRLLVEGVRLILDSGRYLDLNFLLEITMLPELS